MQGWLEDFGLWTISDGLEDPSMAAEHAGPAAAWLIVAGRDIRQDPAWGCRDGNHPLSMPLREAPLWTKKLATGASQDGRWAFWEERLRDIAGTESLDAELRDSAGRAVEAMEAIDSST